MKFLSKLGRFIEKHTNMVRVNIFLFVVFVSVVIMHICMLVGGLTALLVFIATSLGLLLFVVESIFEGNIVRSIDDKIREFKKFE